LRRQVPFSTIETDNGGNRIPAAAQQKQEDIVMKYVCDVCGYVYDEDKGDPDFGIEPTKWEDLPADFECPLCGVGKDDFSPEG
jgi:rubredoxin-NAD+ reductase